VEQSIPSPQEQFSTPAQARPEQMASQYPSSQEARCQLKETLNHGISNSSLLGHKAVREDSALVDREDLDPRAAKVDSALKEAKEDLDLRVVKADSVDKLAQVDSALKEAKVVKADSAQVDKEDLVVPLVDLVDKVALVKVDSVVPLELEDLVGKAVPVKVDLVEYSLVVKVDLEYLLQGGLDPTQLATLASQSLLLQALEVELEVASLMYQQDNNLMASVVEFEV
jgi:hypothetical protein